MRDCTRLRGTKTIKSSRSADRVIGLLSRAPLLMSCIISVLPGCRPPQVELAPPGVPRVEVEVQDDSERVFLHVPRSPDGLGERQLVVDYVPLRARLHASADEDLEYRPFLFEPSPKSTAQTLVFEDRSAVSGVRYRYVVAALASKERMGFDRPGALAVFSEASPVLVFNEIETEAASKNRSSDLQVEVQEAPGGAGEAVVLSIREEGAYDGVPGADGLSGSRFSALRARGDGPYLPFPGGLTPLQPNRAGCIEGTLAVPGPGQYRYRVYVLPDHGEAAVVATVRVDVAERFFNPKRLAVFTVLLLIAGFTLFFFVRTRSHKRSIFIRRIPGVDAIEEAIGRATEMGKPVLYVPGIEEIQNIQTIASLLILGRVAETVAGYDSELLVSCRIPLVATVSEEVVRQGFFDAGRPESHRPHNIRWISSEQFAFVAGTAGIILREQPATNIYLGRFFAESLLLGETGYVNRSIQIAGTAAIPQLPFFIASCDYTLIGEELFAVSAYLTREPRLLSSLKAADFVKAAALVLLLLGSLLSCFDPQGPLTQAVLEFLNVRD
ncbi:MAG: DUF6754 domain-containing protein [Myxococcota bacterium]